MDELRSEEEKKVYEKEMRQAFENTRCDPSRVFFARLIDFLFILGIPAYYFVLYAQDKTTIFTSILALLCTVGLYGIISAAFDSNSIGLVVLGIRNASSRNMKYFVEDTKVHNAVKKAGEEFAYKDEGFQLLEIISGTSSNKIKRLGVVQVDQKKYKEFRKKYFASKKKLF